MIWRICMRDKRNHITSSEKPCWCRPAILMPCTACGDAKNEECWKCDGLGLHEAEPWYEGDLIIIHNEEVSCWML